MPGRGTCWKVLRFHLHPFHIFPSFQCCLVSMTSGENEENIAFLAGLVPDKLLRKVVSGSPEETTLFQETGSPKVLFPGDSEWPLRASKRRANLRCTSFLASGDDKLKYCSSPSQNHLDVSNVSSVVHKLYWAKIQDVHLTNVKACAGLVSFHKKEAAGVPEVPFHPVPVSRPQIAALCEGCNHLLKLKSCDSNFYFCPSRIHDFGVTWTHGSTALA